MAQSFHADQDPMASLRQGQGDDSYQHLDARTRMWLGREVRAEELKQIHWPRWRANWSWYRNYVTPLKDPGQWWRSNEFIPTPFKIVETIIPRYLLGMFDQPDWFAVEARNMRSEEYETLCQNLLRTKLEKMKLFSKVYDAIKYCTVIGHVWGKVVWDEQWMRRKVLMPIQQQDPNTGEVLAGVQEEVREEQVYNGPQFEWLPVDKIWADPSGRERWYIEKIDTTLEEVLETQDYLGIYDKEQLALLTESLAGTPASAGNYDEMGDARQGTAYGHSLDTERQISTMEGIPFSTVAPQRDGVGVELRQCWGWVPKEQRGGDGAEWRLVVIANGQFILRDVPAPTPDGKPPYFPVRSIRIPGRLYGESILYYIGPMADQQSRLANMRLDEVFLGIWQSMLIRQGALASDNQKYFKPGGYMEVKVEPNGRIQDTIMVMPRAPLLPQVWQEDQYRQLQAEHAAAASDIMQGVSGGDRQTATEVERKLQQGNARHVLQTMLFGYDFQKELLERTWEWLRMRMTQPELVKMGEEYAQIDLTQIQTPIDIVVGGGFFALSKSTRLQRSQNLAALLQNPLFAQVAKPIPIFTQLLQDEGWKNVQRFVKTEEELQNEMMQQQTMALLSSLNGGEGAQASEGMGSPPALPNMPGGGGEAGMGGQALSNFGMGGNPVQP